jgi:hypothetical protein
MVLLAHDFAVQFQDLTESLSGIILRLSVVNDAVEPQNWTGCHRDDLSGIGIKTKNKEEIWMSKKKMGS